MVEILFSELKSFKKFSTSRNSLILFLIFFAFFSYGFKIANFTLSIDEELVFNSSSPAAAWISQGRYGIPLLLQIFHQYQLLPFWNSTLSVAFLWLSSIIWCYIIYRFIEKLHLTSFRKNLILFVFAALYLSFPTNAHYIFVSIYNLEVSVGCFLVAISCWCAYQWVSQRRNIYFFIALACMSLALGIYQSFICYFLAGISSIMILSFYTGLLTNKLSTKQHFIILIKIFALTCFSVISYLIISNLFYLIYPSSHYLEGFILWGKMPLKIALQVYDNFYSLVLFKNQHLFYYKLYIATVILSIFSFIYQIIFKEIQSKIPYTLWFLLLLISPFLLTVMLGSLTPLRTLQSAAYLMGFYWLFILTTFTSKKINNALIMISFFVLFLQTQQLALLFQVNYLRSQEDIKNAQQIAEGVFDLNLGETTKYPVVFIGYLPGKIPNNFVSESLGGSFLNWRDGGSYRVNMFMKTLGYDFSPPTLEQMNKAKDLQKNMPDWPNKNSIAFKEGLIIVKLSNT